MLTIIVIYLLIYIYYYIYTLQRNIYDGYEKAGLAKTKFPLLTCNSCKLTRIDCGYEDIKSCWYAECAVIIKLIKKQTAGYKMSRYSKSTIYRRASYHLWHFSKKIEDYFRCKEQEYLCDGPPFALYEERSIMAKIMGSLATIFLKIYFRL
jgi:hypothetical protein